MLRRLYLHETVDVTVEGAAEYMDHIVSFDAEQITDHGLELMGCWHAVGVTGRWPRVVNLWDVVGGWEGWEAVMRRTGLDRPTNDPYRDWRSGAEGLRVGGHDRLLGAVPGGPTYEDLADRDLHASIYVQEIATVHPGSTLEYLAAVRDEAVPLFAEHGVSLVGLWEVLLTDDQVVVMWGTDVHRYALMQRHLDAVRGLAGLEADGSVDGGLGDDGTGDQRLVAWQIRARSMCVRRSQQLLTPHPDALLSGGRSDPAPPV